MHHDTTPTRSQVATIEPNGREYLVTTANGTVFVALSIEEAEAVARLWQSRIRRRDERAE